MVLKKIFDTAVKLSKYDDKAWDALYFGIRKDIAKGIRTGGGLGTVIGEFFRDESSPYDDTNGSVPGKRNGTKAYKFRQKYSRRRVSRCNCRPKYRRYPRRNY